MIDMAHRRGPLDLIALTGSSTSVHIPFRSRLKASSSYYVYTKLKAVKAVSLGMGWWRKDSATNFGCYARLVNVASPATPVRPSIIHTYIHTYIR